MRIYPTRRTIVGDGAPRVRQAFLCHDREARAASDGGCESAGFRSGATSAASGRHAQTVHLGAQPNVSHADAPAKNSMSTSYERSAGRSEGDPQSTAPTPAALRASVAIRLGLAVGIAGVITAVSIISLWGPLHTRATVIGYPIFADYNPFNYSHAYYLTAVFFPVATLLVFLGLTRLAPRLGLPLPSAPGPLRVGATAAAPEPSATTDPSSPIGRTVGCVARIAVVGATLGLEFGVAFDDLRSSILVVTGGYLLAVGATGAVVRRLSTGSGNWASSVAAVNALAAPLTVAGLILVSAHTEVRIDQGGATRHYQWFPWWVGVPLTAALLGWITVACRRAGATLTERRAAFLIAIPVALFVIVGHLPGDLGQLSLFEEGQLLTETMLVGHGWLPWRDIYLAHGLLGDVAPTAIGWGIFGNSYWGAYAGDTVIFLPLGIVGFYYLFTYLVGRSWPLLAIGAALFTGPWLGTMDSRYIIWPIMLLTLAAVLKRPSRPRAFALGLLVIAQAIGTIELGPAAPIVLVVVAAYEWYWRAPEVPWREAFRRTAWLLGGIVVSTLAFVIYMASRGAFGDVIYVTRNLVPGHTLDGGIPPSSIPLSFSQYDFLAFAPIAAMLIAFAYAVARLRLRRPFLLADWPMGAVALFTLVYYSKFLALMDLHVYQPYLVSLPLILYIVFRALTAADRWVRDRLSARPLSWIPAHPTAIVALIAFLILLYTPLRATLHDVPGDYRPSVTTAPIVARVGYDTAADTDAPAIDDLHRIVSAYLSPHGRIYDITNEAALFYYFYGRDPASRWFAPNTFTQTPVLQRNVISELRATRPKLIVFDDTDTTMLGLPFLEGVSSPVRLYLISRWILRHYRPLLVSHNRTIYALPGTPSVSSLHLRLSQRPVTRGVRFQGQACNWGNAPEFLSGAAEPTANAAATPARIVGGQGPHVTLIGWAGDVRADRPAKAIIAMSDGRIVGRATPRIDRPDVVAAGYPQGFLRSGFEISVPLNAVTSKSLRLFAVDHDGSVTQLSIPSGSTLTGTATIDHRPVTLTPSATIGHVDTETPAGSSLQIKPPAGESWGDFRWVEVDFPKLYRTPGGYTLTDRETVTPADTGRLITFSTTAHLPSRYVVPVASCQQWDGFGSERLYLTPPTGAPNPTVKLIR
jgi:hypothetical protein